MSGNGYWNPGQGPDESGPRRSRWRGAEAWGRTCPTKVSGILSKLWICLVPLGILVCGYDSRICTSPAHPIYSP
jgi:hypothetical protein